MSSNADIKALLDSLLPPPTQEPNSPLLQPYFTACQKAVGVLGITVLIDSGTALDRCLYLRNVVRQRLMDISALVLRAKSAGVFISSDPVPQLSSMNVGRTLYRDVSGNVDQLRGSIVTLSKLVDDEQAGRVSFNRTPRPQIGTLEITFDGIDGLPSDVFDADALKRQQALSRLALLDFTKRKVRMLFVVERDNGSAGVDVFVGWKKIRDATGYRLRTRNVFSQEEVVTDISSSDVDSIDADDMSFYREMISPILGEKIREKDVAIHVVEGVDRNTLYSFSVSPYQRVSSAKNDLFRVGLNRLSLTSLQISELEHNIVSLGIPVDAVTPYPFLSEYLYGTKQFGWVLAGVNVLSAFERGDDASSVRSYSYLGATFSGIRGKIESGDFYVPGNVEEFRGRLDSSLSRFGMTNTLAEVLDKCGILMFFDEREGFDVLTSTLSREAALRETSVVAAILSAIDSETATVLPSKIYDRVISTQPDPQVSRSIRTLSFSLSNTTSVRFDESEEEIDLLSFDGISRMLNVIVDASRSAR